MVPSICPPVGHDCATLFFPNSSLNINQKLYIVHKFLKKRVPKIIKSCWLESWAKTARASTIPFQYGDLATLKGISENTRNLQKPSLLPYASPCSMLPYPHVWVEILVQNIVQKIKYLSHFLGEPKMGLFHLNALHEIEKDSNTGLESAFISNPSSHGNFL